MIPQFVVIGAGISGLALGWYLKKRFGNHSLIILEASDRPGGWIRTRQESGFLFEEGPRSCRSKGAGIEALRLIEELGISHEVIKACSDSKKRYLYFNEKLQKLPDSLVSFLKSPLMKGVIPSLWREWQIPRGIDEDESIASFFERRLSKEIAERFIDPLVTGIYAGGIQKLSMKSCFPEIYRQEQEYGSLVKAMFFRKKKGVQHESAFLEEHRYTSLFSFKNGMETLVKALHGKLLQEVKLSCAAKAVYCGEKSLIVTLQDGQELRADRVFLAVPEKIAAKLLKESAPAVEKEMLKGGCATVAVVHMGWHKNVLNDSGFGYLVPSSQKQDVLGVVFDSSAFACQNRGIQETRLTVMMGGMNRPEMETFPMEKLKKIAKEAIGSHLRIYSEPDVCHVSLAKDAIPQYEVGHQARLLRMEKVLKKIFSSRLFLVGSAWRGVSVNDCIIEAKKLADSLAAD